MNGKISSLAGFFMVLAWAGGVWAGAYSGGTGEPNDPYRIATAEDMNAIGAHPNDWDKDFILVNDISLAPYTGTQFNVIGSFSGVFDGNGHAISAFTYEGGSWSFGTGIFRTVAGAVIKDLTLIEPNIASTGYNVGSLVGRFLSGTIWNCRVEGGSVSGNDVVGGLVGRNDNGRIVNCYVGASVSGYQNTGGLVGFNVAYRAEISNCDSAGTVLGSYLTGGLVGSNYKGKVSSCCATGSVTGNEGTGGLVGLNHGKISCSYAAGEVTGADHTGGLVGDNSGHVSNCHAVGSVDGNDYTGGLVGGNYSRVLSCYATGCVAGDRETGGLAGLNSRVLSNCYAVGPVDGNENTGGLVGENWCGQVSNCHAAGAVMGNTAVGGLVGYDFYNPLYCYGGYYASSFWDSTVNPLLEGIGNTSDPNVIGESTEQLRQENTFTEAGWDFVEVWGIGENQTYPFLRQYPAGDSNHDGIVNLLDLAVVAGHWLQEWGQ